MTTATLAAGSTDVMFECEEDDARMPAGFDPEGGRQDASADASLPDVPETCSGEDAPEFDIAAEAYGSPQVADSDEIDAEPARENGTEPGLQDTSDLLEERCTRADDGDDADGEGARDEGVLANLGQRGEEAAAAYLERQGLEILERNWRCRFGEADIIAREDDEVVFVEVKTRQGIEQGMPEDAVTRQKRSRYEKIAASYLSERAFVDCFIRFDVIAILVTNGRQGLLRHHRSAFSHGE